ncbi:hypothetical protein MRX96_008708 [Rhipicephalus microplus]
MFVSPSPTAEVVSCSSAAPWAEEAPEDGVSAGCPPIHLRTSFSVYCSSSIFRVDFSFCFLALANSFLSSLFSFSMFSILAAWPGSAAAHGRPERWCPCAEYAFVPTTMSHQSDTGGPAVAASVSGRFYLVGLLSYATSCSSMGNLIYPSIFTRIDAFASWIGSSLNSLRNYKILLE